MNAVNKHGASFRKPMSGFRILLNRPTECLRLMTTVGALNGRGPRFLEPAEPPHCYVRHCTYWAPLLSVKLPIVLLRFIQRNSKTLNCDASKLLRQLSSTCPPKVRTKSRPMCIFSLTEPVYPLV